MPRRPATVAVTALLAAGALALLPGVAHADGTLGATGQGWALNSTAAAQAAANDATRNLQTAANAAGTPNCSNVTTTTTLVYVVPSGGGYQYSATATGYCAAAQQPPPPPPAPNRTATGSGWGPTQTAGAAAAGNNAVANLNSAAAAAGQTCSNISYTATLVYVVPSGGGYQYSATASGYCV